MNLGYTYYHQEADVVDYGRGILDRATNVDLQTQLFEVESAVRLKLKVLYPGVLLGLGYAHPKLSDDKDDFALGFTFDHTSGLPYLPGSSVKGAIRAAFPRKDSDSGKVALIQNITDKELNFAEIKALERELFENSIACGRMLPYGRRNVFYDGFLSRIFGRLFEEEVITPHGSITCDPIPIRILKIAPETEITLQFGLHHYEAELLSVPERLKLFARIIELHGLGARTSVGFGQVDPIHLQGQIDESLRVLRRTEEERRMAERQQLLASLPVVDRVLEEYQMNVPVIIKAIQNDSLPLEKEHIPELAQRLLAILQEEKRGKKLNKPMKNKFKKRISFLENIINEK